MCVYRKPSGSKNPPTVHNKAGLNDNTYVIGVRLHTKAELQWRSVAKWLAEVEKAARWFKAV